MLFNYFWPVNILKLFCFSASLSVFSSSAGNHFESQISSISSFQIYGWDKETSFLGTIFFPDILFFCLQDSAFSDAVNKT
jgi:hypothetical protein